MTGVAGLNSTSQANVIAELIGCETRLGELDGSRIFVTKQSFCFYRVKAGAKISKCRVTTASWPL